LLVISPYSKINYIDHTVSDQASILRFIEDNWNLGKIGDQSFDSIAGSLDNMFNFDLKEQSIQEVNKLILDPNTGNIIDE
jgi:phospholipase C